MMLVLALMSGMAGSPMPSPQQLGGIATPGSTATSMSRVQVAQPRFGTNGPAMVDPSNFSVNVRNLGEPGGPARGPAVVIQSTIGVQRMVGDKPSSTDKPQTKPDTLATPPPTLGASGSSRAVTTARRDTSDAAPTAPPGTQPVPMVAGKGLDSLAPSSKGQGFQALN